MILEVRRRRHFGHLMCGLVALLASCGESRVTRAQEGQGAEQAAFDHPILRAINHADKNLATEFTVVFEMRKPALRFDPGQGTQINRCTFTSGTGVRGLTVESKYSAEPVYRKPGTTGYQAMDFDIEGNLIVWRSLGKQAITTGDLNRVYDVQQMNRVSPDGIVLERVSHTQVYEYPPGSTDSMYEIAQLELATGRGFYKHLDSFKSEKTREDGLLQVVAAGTFGRPGLVGEWELILDPKAGHLVREAALRVETLDRPAIRVVTRGSRMVRGVFSLAQSGTIYFAQNGDNDYRIDVSLLEYRPSNPDLAHLRSLHELLASPIRNGVEVVDYTGPQPRRYVIGAEDRE